MSVKASQTAAPLWSGRSSAASTKGRAVPQPAERHRDGHEHHGLNDHGTHDGHGVVAVAADLVVHVLHAKAGRGLMVRVHARAGEPRRIDGRIVEELRLVGHDAAQRGLNGSGLHGEGAVAEHVHGDVLASGEGLLEVLRNRDENRELLAPEGLHRLAFVLRDAHDADGGRGVHGRDETAGGGRAVKVEHGRRDVLDLLVAVGPGVEDQVEGDRAREDEDRVAGEKGGLDRV